MSRLIPLLALFALCTGLHAGTTPPSNRAEIRAALLSPVSASSLVRVNSTNQNYQLLRPWLKRAPFNRRGTGVVLANNQVLVTAELVANSNFIELENPETQARSVARVALADYEANLALLAPEDPDFLDGSRPIKIATNLGVGDRVEITQMEPTGSLARTPGTITTVTLGGYPADGTALLVYRVSVPLQYRDNSFNLPVFSGSELAGILMRYDARTQSADLVPAPVISSFLKRAEAEEYQSFPRIGVALAPTRDPKFRRFLGMAEDQSGAYVSSVIPGGPAANAGLEPGDVILKVDQHRIDNEGNYTHLRFGKIPFAHLISTERMPGDEVTLEVLRDGETKSVTATLAPRDMATMISEPFFVDRSPSYLVVGGIVMQELNRAVLREWGGDWRNTAPARLAFLDEFQDELPADRGKIIFISGVLPNPTAIGYEDLSTTVVEKINGIEIRSLQDAARALANPVNGFHRIEIDSDPRLIILDAAEAAAQADWLKETYGLPTLERL